MNILDNNCNVVLGHWTIQRISQESRLLLRGCVVACHEHNNIVSIEMSRYETAKKASLWCICVAALLSVSAGILYLIVNQLISPYWAGVSMNVLLVIFLIAPKCLDLVVCTLRKSRVLWMYDRSNGVIHDGRAMYVRNNIKYIVDLRNAEVGAFGIMISWPCLAIVLYDSTCVAVLPGVSPKYLTRVLEIMQADGFDIRCE